MKHRMWEMLLAYRGKLSSAVPAQKTDQKHLQGKGNDLFTAEFGIGSLSR